MASSRDCIPPTLFAKYKRGFSALSPTREQAQKCSTASILCSEKTLSIRAASRTSPS